MIINTKQVSSQINQMVLTALTFKVNYFEHRRKKQKFSLVMLFNGYFRYIRVRQHQKLLQVNNLYCILGYFRPTTLVLANSVTPS